MKPNKSDWRNLKKIKMSIKEIEIINYGYGEGELVQGFAILSVKKRILVKNIIFAIEGETALATKAKKKPSVFIPFYDSPKYEPIGEQGMNKMPCCKEYLPGNYPIAFSIQIPKVPLCTTQIGYEVGIHYYVKCRVEDNEKPEKE